jgi:phosphatidylglycerol:prolipoprotein diacylglycerol transferase
VHRVIPYVSLPVYDLGPIPLDPWGILVTIGFVLGLEVARSRGIRMGLEVPDVVDGIVATVLTGFVVGHEVHVLAYHYQDVFVPQGIRSLLEVWKGFSSFGGFLGAVIGSVVFYRFIRRKPWLPHADAIMYGFPFAWVFGRLGCFSVHDHIGRLTDFPLAVAFPGGPRHDLGLYEALWTMGIAATFCALGRKERPAGTFLATWCVMYAPIRFLSDFLRNTDLKNADVRWAGLTPAQWGTMVMFGAGLALWGWLRRRG